MNLTKASAVTGVRKNKKGEVVAFNINRKNWGRGDRGGSLFEYYGVQGQKGQQGEINMCCLGVYGRACGISVKRLKNLSMPSQVSGRLPKSFRVFLEESHSSYIDNDLAAELAAYNDNSDTTDETKEREIIEGFGKLGIKVKFVGEG